MITELETYFTDGCGRCPRFSTPDCSVALWRDAVLALRQLCQDADLEETLRWGHPCYRAGGRNVAIIGAFRDGPRLSFFHPGLLKDPSGLLVKSGPNTAHPDMIPFADTQDIHRLRADVLALLAEAKAYAEAGLKQPVSKDVPDLPDSLLEALAADPELSEAFDALTPGRKRSYVIHLSSAKTEKTRQARIARCRDKILAGKGAMER